MLRPVLRFPAAAALVATARCCRAGAARRSACTRRLMGVGDLPRELPIVQHLREDPEGVPGRADAGRGGRCRPPTSSAAPIARGDRASCERWRCASGQARQPIERPGERRATTVAKIEVPLVGNGDERRVDGGARRRCATRVLPASIGRVPGRELRGDRRDGRHAATSTTSIKQHVPARVRVRARAGVPAAADHVPLAGDPADLDRAEPAVGRRGLRRARVDLPGRATCRDCSASTPTVRS